MIEGELRLYINSLSTEILKKDIEEKNSRRIANFILRKLESPLILSVNVSITDSGSERVNNKLLGFSS